MTFVARLASPILDLFRVFHLYESPNLKLREHSFDVQELLLNPVSVQMMIVLSIIVSLLRRRGLMVGLMNCVSAGVWTLIGQLLFLVTIALFSQNAVDLTASRFNLNLCFAGCFSLFSSRSWSRTRFGVRCWPRSAKGATTRCSAVGPRTCSTCWLNGLAHKLSTMKQTTSRSSPPGRRKSARCFCDPDRTPSWSTVYSNVAGCDEERSSL